MIAVFRVTFTPMPKTTAPVSPTLCCIGHITVDDVITPHASVTMPGGTAYYFSLALCRMPVRCLLVTTVGHTELPVVETLRAKGIETTVLPSDHSVHFENRYGDNPDQRTQRVLQKAAPFHAASFAGVRADIFHLGPLLADDFSVNDIRLIAAKGKLSLDVQGFLRRVEVVSVVPVDWVDKKDVLPLVHFLKTSEEEMAVLTGTDDVQEGAKMLAGWGAKEVIITLGSRGSVVFAEGRFYYNPAYKPQHVQDSTR
jgi:sugar/nucleoside kinase (ribokinase family)